MFLSTDKMTGLGNKLLVYVSCCLAGVAYPHGFIDPETSENIKNQVRALFASNTTGCGISNALCLSGIILKPF